MDPKVQRNVVIAMTGIRKEFPGILANDDVSIELLEGEVLALLGENGAGKSTLMSILFGLCEPDAGTIRVRGETVRISSPADAGKLGIGMVHQHFKLVHDFTITENIVLGIEPRRGWKLNLPEAARRVRHLSEHYGLNVDPEAGIDEVSVGMQQRVEILKMLYRDAEILIFDEPTAVLTPQEINEFMGIVKNLIAEGKSVILITHKLKEIQAVADRCTVIRRGRVTGTVNVADTSPAEMAEMMVGRKVSFSVTKAQRERGDKVLDVRNLHVRGARGIEAVKGISLDVHQGEILGLAGVDGNGQSELVEALTGLTPVQSGRIILEGRDITDAGIARRMELGMAHIPEDRQKRALVLDYSVEDNCILGNRREKRFNRMGFIRREAVRRNAEAVMADFDVRCAGGGAGSARSLSGGNQQKLVAGREVSRDPVLLIAVQPTRGLDVGSIEYIHKRLTEQRDSGRGVLLVSLELDEILSLADRVAVISRGGIIGVEDTRNIDEQSVGLMMAGVTRGA